MKHRDEKGDDSYAEDMIARAEQLEPTLEVKPKAREMGSPGRTILQHVSRLCTEWAEADPIKTEKRQSVYGTWAQIWNANARGMFSINLNTGTVWQTKTRPPSKPIGNVRELTGEQLVEFLRQ